MYILAMDELDGDEKRVSYNGMYAERDIVQVCIACNSEPLVNNVHYANAPTWKSVKTFLRKFGVLWVECLACLHCHPKVPWSSPAGSKYFT